jgi:S1-C subfamily serine protease
MSVGLLTSEFKGSILRLQVEGSLDSGTGYLIDSVNGYIITAFHVVESATPNTTIINVTSPYSTLNKDKLKAKLVKSLATRKSADGTLDGPDLAILKLDNPSLVKDLRPLDISLRYPSVDNTLYAMGYPTLGDQPNTTFSEQLVRFMARPIDNSIQVEQATFGGNSGGPLMNSSGSVVGTCRNSIGSPSVVAQYVPMIDGMKLFDLIPLSDRMKSLDKQIRSGSVPESELMDLLVTNSRNPTNLEWYTWSKHVIAHLDQYASNDSTSKLLRCATYALGQRGMEGVVVNVSAVTLNLRNLLPDKGFGNHFDLPPGDHFHLPLVDLKTAGDAYIRVAESEFAQGRLPSAMSHVSIADSVYEQINDKLGAHRAGMLSIRIRLADGTLDAAQLQTTNLLSDLDMLPPEDKSTALSIASSIDLVKGNLPAAVSELNDASRYSFAAGKLTTAADLLVSSADASIKLSKSQDAKDSLTKAIVLYQSTNNISGEAESVYKLALVESVLGDRDASMSNLQHYLALQPHGVHAAGAIEILAIRPNTH